MSPAARGRFRHVVLVGAMGSGKSTIGAPLATALQRAFVDNDERLVRATGLTAAQLAERDGVEAMHAAEAAVLLDALRSPKPAVIAAAASTITDAAVRDALARDAYIIWLRASPETLARRLPQSTARPFAAVDPGLLVEQQALERDSLFAQVADLELRTETATPDALVALVLESLPRRSTTNG